MKQIVDFCRVRILAPLMLSKSELSFEFFCRRLFGFQFGRLLNGVLFLLLFCPRLIVRPVFLIKQQYH